MNRLLTNACRFILDECIPSVIRDSKLFMYPFYFVAYRGKNISQAMNFKSLVYDWTPEQYANFYRNLDTVSRNRETDLSWPCTKKILEAIPNDAQTILDFGCGHGYLMKKILAAHPATKITGCDLKTPAELGNLQFRRGDLFEQQFADNSFDVVTCCHTLEHLIDAEKYCRELIRLAKRQLIVVVPCQRYYFYTLDEHVNFFPDKEQLTSLIGLKDFRCEKVFGDWLYVGTIR